MALEQLKEEVFAWPFLYPVNTALYPDYLVKVSEPCDLGTIAHRLAEGHYDEEDGADAMTRDMRLVMENCIQYNGRRIKISQSARQTFATFHRWLRQWVTCGSADDDSADVTPVFADNACPGCAQRVDSGRNALAGRELC